jgi:hypothetical protein
MPGLHYIACSEVVKQKVPYCFNGILTQAAHGMNPAVRISG